MEWQHKADAEFGRLPVSRKQYRVEIFEMQRRVVRDAGIGVRGARAKIRINFPV
jgi:hypothetical protein